MVIRSVLWSMDKDQLLDVIPHYVAMMLAVFLVLGLIRRFVGDIEFWVEIVIIFLVVFAYRPLVMRLGVGPKVWAE